MHYKHKHNHHKYKRAMLTTVATRNFCKLVPVSELHMPDQQSRLHSHGLYLTLHELKSLNQVDMICTSKTNLSRRKRTVRKKSEKTGRREKSTYSGYDSCSQSIESISCEMPIWICFVPEDWERIKSVVNKFGTITFSLPDQHTRGCVENEKMLHCPFPTASLE